MQTTQPPDFQSSPPICTILVEWFAFLASGSDPTGVELSRFVASRVVLLTGTTILTDSLVEQHR